MSEIVLERRKGPEEQLDQQSSSSGRQRHLALIHPHGGVPERVAHVLVLQAAQGPNHVWALDFQFDETPDGRHLKLLNVVDEFTREALAWVVGRSMDPRESSARSNGSPPSGALRSICGWTTAPS